MAIIKQCDTPGCESVIDVERMFFEEGHRKDAAGETEPYGLTIDLCLKCQSRALKELCKRYPSDASSVADIVRGWQS